jgi:anti-sigma regulatory factor (Ser/Thr protein kinase)
VGNEALVARTVRTRSALGGRFRFPGLLGWAFPVAMVPFAGRRGTGSSIVLLPATPASVAVARRRLAADLIAAGIFDTVIRDVALVISELLSNAIRHAQSLPGSRVQVTWNVATESVEVAVSDGGSPTRPRQTKASLSALGGRGLGIVEHISHTWGVRSGNFGLTVWAVIPAPPAARTEAFLTHSE